MKFTTLVEPLKKAINAAERITGKNITLPMLANILLKVNKNSLQILATDLEIGVDIIVSGRAEEEGEVVIPAKVFNNFLSNLSEEKINLIQDGQNLKVEDGKHSVMFQGFNIEDFPIIPHIKSDKYISINKIKFQQSLEQVIPAINNVSSKVELNGVFLKLEKNNLRLVGTDSFRLAEKIITKDNYKTNITNDISLIIPLKVIQELLRLIAENNNETELIEIIPEINQVQFNLGDLRLISQLINTQYPNYSAIIPQSFEYEIITPKEDLIEAVKLSGLFSGKINNVKFIFSPTKHQIITTAEDPTLGAATNISPILNIKGPKNDLEINLNYRFFLDGLNSTNYQEIFIGLNKDINPILIKGKEENDFFYLLMPLKM